MNEYQQDTSCYKQPGRLVSVIWLTWVLLGLTGYLFVSAARAGATADSANAPLQSNLLAIYILAYDNSPEVIHTVNLTTKYTETVQSIVQGTAGHAGVTAVILADLDSYGDTHILLSENGSVTRVTGLPDTNGQLNPQLDEYDTTDGATLGGFLLWARALYPERRVLLSYIGHGTQLAPKTSPSIGEIIQHPPDGRLPEFNSIPMPTDLDVHAEFTDAHAPGQPTGQMITPYDLGYALALLTENGANPIDVLDLLHCFAATIEELYEVAPYAITTVAAPNYAFFDPAMSGQTLSALAQLLNDSPNVPAMALANTLVSKYFEQIPPLRHPHVLVSFNNSQLLQLKPQWDTLAQMILDSFASNPQATTQALANAYESASQNFGLYDSTFCGVAPDFRLEAPDALADMGKLAQAIGQHFYAINPMLALQAYQTATMLGTAVHSIVAQNGQPWWVANPTTWNFSGVSGVGIYAPFVPMEMEDLPFHSWQALWYTDTLLIASDVPIGGQLRDVLNPHPYAFVQRNGGGATWADVLDVYWRQAAIHPRQDVATALCLPRIQEIEEPDLQLVARASAPVVQATRPLTYGLTVINRTTLMLPDVVVTNTLPSGVNFLSASPAVCAYNAEAHQVVCPLGNLSAHAQEEIVLVTEVALETAGSALNRAEVRTSAAETRLADNTAVVQTTVLSAWQLALDGVSEGVAVGEGEVVLYTAVLENTGLITATQLHLAHQFGSDIRIAGDVIVTPSTLHSEPNGDYLLVLPQLAPQQRVTVTLPIQLRRGPAVIQATTYLTSSEVSQPVPLTLVYTTYNLPPTARPDFYHTITGETLHVPAPGVMLNDSDPGDDFLYVLMLRGAENGQAILNTDGSMTYTPMRGFIGRDTFTYVLRDGDGGEDWATITIQVEQVLYLPLIRH